MGMASPFAFGEEGDAPLPSLFLAQILSLLKNVPSVTRLYVMPCDLRK